MQALCSARNVASVKTELSTQILVNVFARHLLVLGEKRFVCAGHFLSHQVLLETEEDFCLADEGFLFSNRTTML